MITQITIGRGNRAVRIDLYPGSETKEQVSIFLKGYLGLNGKAK